MLDTRVYKWFRRLIEMGLLLVAFGIVLQIIFSGHVAFLPGDIIGNITAKVAHLGDYGLAGIVVGGGLFWLFLYAGVWRDGPKPTEDTAPPSVNSSMRDKPHQASRQ